MVGGEVIGVEEQPDATAGLIADGRPLGRSCRNREDERRAAGVRRYPHPPRLRRERRVLDQREAEVVHVVGDRLVVVVDEQGHRVQAHDPTVAGGRR